MSKLTQKELSGSLCVFFNYFPKSTETERKKKHLQFHIILCSSSMGASATSSTWERDVESTSRVKTEDTTDVIRQTAISSVEVSLQTDRKLMHSVTKLQMFQHIPDCRRQPTLVFHIRVSWPLLLLVCHRSIPAKNKGQECTLENCTGKKGSGRFRWIFSF